MSVHPALLTIGALLAAAALLPIAAVLYLVFWIPYVAPWVFLMARAVR